MALAHMQDSVKRALLIHKMTLAIECRNNGLLTLLPKQKTVFSPCTLTEERGDEMRKTDGLNEHYIILSLATAQNIAYSI